ncbi:MAG: glycosyltransferase [Vicingaceae bacterium]|nr:glycosyltransferase [Vicingaceae bacterium]
MVVVTIGFYRERQGINKSKKNVKISVLIPVRNEEEMIIKCLNSLENQNYDKLDFEIIIINDHSTDKSVELIKKHIDISSYDYSLYELIDQKSKKEALKLGVRNATYSIVATTDSDCELPKNWLNIIASKIDGKDMLLGPLMFKNGKGFLNKFQILDMMAMQGLEFGTLNFGTPILNNAANLAYKKESLMDVGGYDNYLTPSGDDVFLLEKFINNNKLIVGGLTKSFIVETPSEKGLKAFFNQRRRWSSKSKFYKNKSLIFFSVIILIQNIVSLFIYIGLPLVENYSSVLTILLLSKWVIDFILLLLVASFFDKKRVLIYFIPVQLLYPIYLVGIWIASITMNYNWKGRKY